MKKVIILLYLILTTITNTFATSEYTLTIKDKIFINDITQKINKLTDTKWDTYAIKYVFALDKSLKNYEIWSRSYKVFNTIKTNIVSHIQSKNKPESETIIIEEKSKVAYKSTMNFSEYKIDMEKVKLSWLWYFNEVRKNMWREVYSYDEILNNTAQEWSETSLDRWIMSHKRDTNDSYYNYSKINSWFADRWVVCKNINRVTHSENIWRWYYKCSSYTDCTDKLITWTKEVFDMYMAEKNKSYKAHYESIIRREFRKIWLWIAIHNSNDWFYEFYITTHYCTEVK